jgi:hypothetical protein
MAQASPTKNPNPFGALKSVTSGLGSSPAAAPAPAPAAAAPAAAATPSSTGAGAGTPGQSGFKDFSSASMVEGSKDFLESNSWVAKIAFLLMVIIGFAILFRLMIAFISWLFSPSGKVVLVDGYINGAKSTIISQDPSVKQSVTIIRSNNQKDGIEFTWSVWLFLNGFTDDTTFHHVFNKGNKEFNNSGIVTPNNAPGLYIKPKYDGIRLIMNSFDDPNLDSDVIDVNDLPITKWMNIVIRVQGRNCDIYVNGRLTKRRLMKNPVKQNYDDVNICMNGGFSGFLSSLTYYNNAISIAEIQDILVSGPNMKSAEKNLDDKFTKPRYMADRWYFDQNNIST